MNNDAKWNLIISLYSRLISAVVLSTASTNQEPRLLIDGKVVLPNYLKVNSDKLYYEKDKCQCNNNEGTILTKSHHMREVETAEEVISLFNSKITVLLPIAIDELVKLNTLSRQD